MKTTISAALTMYSTTIVGPNCAGKPGTNCSKTWPVALLAACSRIAIRMLPFALLTTQDQKIVSAIMVAVLTATVTISNGPIAAGPLMQSTDLLYAFGKEWLNPVPRASAIEKVSADPDIADSDKAAIAAFAASAAAGKSMPMVPQYSQLLDVLGIMQSGVMSVALTIDQALEKMQDAAGGAGH